MGFSARGTITVTDSSVTCVIDLPWAAIMFQGKIEEAEKKMRQELEKILL